MTPERLQQIRELFEAALERTAGERTLFVAGSAGADEDLRQAVERMLAADASAEGPLDEKTTGPGANRRIGPYRIDRELGRGGMGTVYLATRADAVFSRQVAIKVIRSERVNPESVSRFQQEREILAGFDHPNIARVYDGGTTDDLRPFFVMEYIEGEPIDRYADQHKLNVTERLRLFESVCSAVRYAHQKLIVHRDLKPSNILVTPTGMVKLLDFGIAKLLAAGDLTGPLLTRLGDFPMTPEYASPEQVMGAAIHTSSDIYSLGVLLYELLTGQRPYRLENRILQEVTRVICHTEPAPPSKAIADNPADASSEVREGTSARLKKRLEGDLDNIILKALQKEPERRYASVEQFGNDLERHLQGLPILARRDSFLYRTGKFVRRNRLTIAAGGLVLLSLTAGLIGTTWQARVAHSERIRAERQAQAAALHAGQAEGHQRNAEAQREIAEQARLAAESEKKVSIEQRKIAERNRLEAELETYRAGLSSAQILIGMRKIDEARKQLLRTPPGLRGWEWKYRYTQVDSSIATLNTEPVRPASWYRTRFAEAPGTGKYILNTGSALYTWAADFTPADIRGGYGEILAVSRSGSRIISRPDGPDGPIRVINPRSGAVISTLRNARGAVDASAFTPQETRVVISFADRRLGLWDAGSGEGLIEPSVRPWWLTFLAFNADGTQLVAGPPDGSIVILDAASLKQTAVIGGSQSKCNALAFSPSGAHVACGTVDGTVRVVDVRTARSLFSVRGHDEDVTAIDFSPDGQRLATASLDRSVRLWHVNSGRLLATLFGHTGRDLRSIAFSADSRYVLCADAESGSVRVWDADASSDTLLQQPTPDPRFMFFSPDASMVAASTRVDSTIPIWDTKTGRKLRELAGHEGIVRGIAFHPAGRLLASTANDKTVRLWDISTGRNTAVLTGHEEFVQALAFNSKGDLLASGSLDGAIRLWSVATGDVQRVIHVSDPVSSITFHPDGKKLIVAIGYSPSMKSPALQVRNISDGRLIAKSLAPGDSALDRSKFPIMAVALSPDGKRVVSSGVSDILKWGFAVWETQSGQLVHTMPDGEPFVTNMRFSPDGTRFAAAGPGQVIRMWDTASFEELQTITMEPRVLATQFSPDGRHLTAIVGDDVVRVLRTDSAYPPEAEKLVAELFARYISAAEVMAHIRSDRTVNTSFRGAALTLARTHGDDPVELNMKSWGVVVLPGASPHDYDLALRRAELAAKRMPWSSGIANTLGLAQYRTGRFQEAIRSFESSDRLARSPGPTNAAFTALSYFRLGEVEKAVSLFQKLGHVKQEPRWSIDRDLRTMYHEAEQVLGKPAR
jgi:WD40 repeat protein/serine/threonine protein kinase